MSEPRTPINALIQSGRVLRSRSATSEEQARGIAKVPTLLPPITRGERWPEEFAAVYGGVDSMVSELRRRLRRPRRATLKLVHLRDDVESVKFVLTRALQAEMPRETSTFVFCSELLTRMERYMDQDSYVGEKLLRLGVEIPVVGEFQDRALPLADQWWIVKGRKAPLEEVP